MSTVKRDDQFSSDGDAEDDIPLVSDAPEASSIVAVKSAPIPQLQLITYHLNWTVGGLSSSIKQIHFLNQADVWLFSAESKEISGTPSYVITAAHDTALLARLETPKIPAYTLLAPHSNGEIDILGLVWEGATIKVAFCSAGTVYSSSSQDVRLAMLLKEGKALPPNAHVFASKAPPVNDKGKPVWHPELPELSEPCEKNFVVEDSHGVSVMKVYKMAERFFGVQAAPSFAPLVAFGCAIAVIVKCNKNDRSYRVKQKVEW
jgi:hypothetical protein